MSNDRCIGDTETPAAPSPCDVLAGGLQLTETPVTGQRGEGSPPEALAGTFFTTLLDSHETNVGLRSTSLPIPEPEESHSLCTQFRHSCWKSRREATNRALRKADISKSGIDRFCKCGERAWILRTNETEPRYRLALNRCRSRWCVPCANEQRNVIQRNVMEACEGKDLRFMTLTLKSSQQPLGQQISRLRKSFRKLRQRRDFKTKLRGGIYFLELTKNKRTNEWHPHLHILFEGGFVPHGLLKNAWREITADSYIVDVRRVPNSKVAAGYISKYAGKPLPTNIIFDTESMVEAITALHGTRVFSSFGTWKELHLSKPPSDDTPWIPLMPLSACIMNAMKGDLKSRQIIESLTRRNAHEPMELNPNIPP